MSLILKNQLEERKDNMNFNGKKILFISPEFFGIDNEIISELENRGANVEWFDERSVKTSFGRALNSIYPKLFYRYANKYYKNKVGEIKTDIDIVFVIKGDQVTKKTISLIRNRWPNAEIILYLYDPIENIKGIASNLQYYDRTISFEPEDCRKYGMEFRPLFSDFVNSETACKDMEYDICFYGTMYGDRFRIVDNVKKYCENNELKFYSFCFLRGKFMALYYWITNKGFRKLGINSISFKSKQASELADIVSKSKVVLDANDVKQEGLTLRTLETLLSGKKMITTNKNIASYDFYNPNNILIIERENIQIDKDFINKKYVSVEKSVLYRYTVIGWVDDVFGKC